LTSVTIHGGFRSSAPVNRASTPTLNSMLLTAAPATSGQAQRQSARNAQRARRRLSITTVGFRTKRRGASDRVARRVTPTITRRTTRC
jgi:hypothetical protein